jgi:exonuclease SbcD
MQVLHFADLHLGVETYGRVDPGTGLHSRLMDFTRSLAHVIDCAIERRVDLVLFCGDAYRNCDPSPTHQRELGEQLRRLCRERIPAVLVAGNHDIPVAYGKAISFDIFETLELEGISVVRRPELLRVETQSGPLEVAALPWPTRHLLKTRDEFSDRSQEGLREAIEEICRRQIEQFVRESDPALPTILAAHVAASEATFSGSEKPAVIGSDPTLLTSALAKPEFDYVALGHVHKQQDLNRGNAPPVVYSGSIERVDFGEERDDKGFCLVDIATTDRGRSTSYAFLPVPARRFLTVDVEVKEREDPTSKILDALKAEKIAGTVLRVRCQLPEGPSANIDMGPIGSAAQGAHVFAGVFPIRPVAQRHRRSMVTEEMGMQEALNRYIDNLPLLHGQRPKLLEYAALIEADLIASTSGERP